MSWRGTQSRTCVSLHQVVPLRLAPASAASRDMNAPRRADKPSSFLLEIVTVMTRLRRVRYGKSRPIREERRVGALRIMRRSTIRRQYMTPRVYLRQSPGDSERSLGKSVPAAKHTHPCLIFMIRRLQGRCLSLGGHRVTDRLLRRLHDCG